MDVIVLDEIISQNRSKVEPYKKPLHHVHKPKPRKKCYCSDQTKKIQAMYILAACLWLVILYFGRFAEKYDYISLIILAVPLIVYCVNYNGCGFFEEDSADDIFRGNFLTFGYLIFIVFMNWGEIKNKNMFFRILVVSVVLIMFSLIDLWVDKENMELLKHSRTAIQTAALSLLVFALYQYYLTQRE